MQKIFRVDTPQIKEKLQHNPAVALLGPRQVGKSTLAKDIVSEYPNALYLDLEQDSDRRKVESHPELFFQANSNRLICFDEVQFLPDIFKVLRGVIDKQQSPGQFLILGSASRDLIRQSSETLAGRISYVEMSPFFRVETSSHSSLLEYWLRGGYPRSFLASNDSISFDWREDYIKSFLERDLPSLGFRIPSTTLRRFWTMLAHCQGQVINYSKLGNSLGVSDHTIKNYIDILEQTFVIRVLQPYHSNIKKRLIKSPKIYIRDTGILHALLRIESLNDLLGHPSVGASFETLILENIIKAFPRYDCFFYRDSTDNEIDLVLQKALKTFAFEIKASPAPQLSKGFHNACKVIQPQKKWLICQTDQPYPGKNDLEVINLDNFLEHIEHIT